MRAHGLVVVLAVVVAAAACGGSGEESVEGGAIRVVAAPETELDSWPALEDPSDAAVIYGAIAGSFSSEMAAYDDGTPPVVYVIEGSVSTAGNPEATGEQVPLRPFSESVRQAIATPFPDTSVVEFVPDFASVVPEPCEGVINNGVLLTFGPVTRRGQVLRVGVEMYIGCLAGRGELISLAGSNGEYEITGSAYTYQS